MKMFYARALVLLALAIAFVGGDRSTFAQETKAQLTTLNNLSFLACGNGCITGPILNSWNGNFLNSVGTLLDAQTWAAQQTFTLPPIVTSLAGSGTRCATFDPSGMMGAVNCQTLALVPGATPISPSTNGGALYDNAGVLGDSLNPPFAPAQVYEANNNGLSTASLDNQAALQALENTCSANNGWIDFGAGTYLTSQITILSNCHWTGRGHAQTIIKAVAGINTDLLIGQNANSLWATNSEGGISNFGFSDMDVDGNAANQSAGSCLAVYGYRYELQNFQAQNCYEHGIRSGWGPFSPSNADQQMDSLWLNVSTLNTGKHGVWFAGPHDSSFIKVHPVNSSQLADNTYHGFFNDRNGNGRAFDLHPWEDSSQTNRPDYAMYDSGGMDVSSSHFEGARTGALYLKGKSNYGNSNRFYAIQASPTSIILADTGSNNSNITGIITAKSGQTGIAVKGSGLTINLNGSGTSSTALDFTSDGGLNNINVVWAGAAAGYIGTPAASDTIIFNQFAATSNGNLNQLYLGLKATTTNNNAAAGNIGEYVSSQCPSGITANQATITLTIASPMIITWPNSTTFLNSAVRQDACPLSLATTGALPTGPAILTTYWIIPSSINGTDFQVADTLTHALAGTDAINASGSQSGTQTGIPGAILTSATGQSITGLALTPGDWQVGGDCGFLPGNTTTVSYQACGVNTSISAGTPQANGTAKYHTSWTGTNTLDDNLPTSPIRALLSTNVNEFLVSTQNFAVSTSASFGGIWARRIR